MTQSILSSLERDRTVPEDFSDRDTIPTPPPECETGTAPPPARVTWGEIGLVLFAVAGAACGVYLGFEWAHHWDLGGWLGVEWFASIVFAAALVGAGLATAVMMRRLRR